MYSYGIQPEDLWKHALVLGGSGSGKTNLVINMARQLLSLPQLCVIWCFDFLGEYRELLRSNGNILVLKWQQLRWNVLRPPATIDVLEWIQVFAEVYSHAWRVLTASKSFVHTTLHDLMELYSFGQNGVFPTLPDYLLYLHSLKMTKVIWNYLPLNLLRITSICKSIGDVVAVNRGFLPELVDRNVVFELHGLGESELQNFLIELAMSYAFYARRDVSKR